MKFIERGDILKIVIKQKILLYFISKNLKPQRKIIESSFYQLKQNVSQLFSGSVDDILSMSCSNIELICNENFQNQCSDKSHFNSI